MCNKGKGNYARFKNKIRAQIVIFDIVYHVCYKFFA
jgi:hypothetical protein